jgi:hypothetical protein
MAAAVSLLCGGVFAQEAQRITIPAGELRWDEKGFSLSPSWPECPSSSATGVPSWRLILEPAQGSEAKGDVLLESHRQTPPKVAEASNELTLSYPTLTDGKNRLEIALTLTIRGAGDRFEIDGEIQNGTKDWVVKVFRGPVFSGIRTELAKTPLLMPDGFGCRVNRLPSDEKDMWPWRKMGNELTVTAHYPSAAGTMQWFAFAGEAGGLYFGCHDARCQAKALRVSYDPERKTFSAMFQHGFFLRPGERRPVPTMIVKPYQGDWHAAARVYRTWVDSVSKPIERPAWAKTASGWLLAILKQQNGEIIWPYDTLDKLSEIADQRGLDILGLFGWGYGGHDHLYPDYNPCPLMGGEKALREGIKKAHARGKRVILYANGQLMERGTAYWSETGQHLAVTKKDGGTVQEFWHKYQDAPGYHFDIGCNVAKGWRDRLLMLAMQANSLGADGILYDQLGGRGPLPCYAEGHGHPVPAMVYEYDRKEMLREIAEKMKGVNPDFVLMTEGFFDTLLDSIAYFHGYLLGIFKDSADRIACQQREPGMNGIFPEMARYTYPEVACTVRVPSPLMSRSMANYTCAYGWRLEIETRYAPDRDYLLTGHIPKVEDYGTVLDKPDLSLMQSLPAGETAAYMRRVAEFQKRNTPLLMTGTFTDTEGFTCKGAGVVAKGYKAGDLLGVVLWNTSDKSAAFTLRVPEAECVSASEPEQGTIEAFSPLAPQTLRLIVWKRRGS